MLKASALAGATQRLPPLIMLAAGLRVLLTPLRTWPAHIVLGLAHAGRRERHADRAEEHEARRQAIEAAMGRLDQLRAERDLSEDVVHPLRARHRDRLRHIEHRSDGDHRHRKLTEIHNEIELSLIAAERQRINELFRSGRLKDEARRRIERELDLREAHLASQRVEE